MSRVVLLCVVSVLSLIASVTAAQTSGSYAYVISSATPCSAACNGFTTRTVQCIDSVTGLAVLSDFCVSNQVSVPTLTTTCNYCPFVLSWSDWGVCDATCAFALYPKGGVQTRQAQCQAVSTTVPLTTSDKLATNYTSAPTILNNCGKPSDFGLPSFDDQTRPCNTQQCVGNTYIEKFVSSDCTGECGQQGTFVQQTCVNSVGAEINNNQCNGLGLFNWKTDGGRILKPCVTKTPCVTKLVATPYSTCSVPCGGGVQTRNFTCSVWSDFPGGGGMYTNYPLITPSITDPSGWFYRDVTGGPTSLVYSPTNPNYLSLCTLNVNISTPAVNPSSLVRGCNTDKCVTPFSWQCTAWTVDFAAYQYNAGRTCTCIDSSNNNRVVEDKTCISAFLPKPEVLATPSSVGLALNRLISNVSDCSAPCSVAGQESPFRIRTWTCQNIDGSFPTDTYSSWLVTKPECTIRGFVDSTKTATWPVQIRESCNANQICTDIAWGITYTAPCPAKCENTVPVDRTVKCVLLGSGEFIPDARCPPAAKPATQVACNTQDCTYEWRTGPWETCSQACVPASYFSGARNSLIELPTQTRAVECYKSDGTRVDSQSQGLCTSAKPATSQYCNMIPCKETVAIVPRTTCGKCAKSSTEKGTKFTDCFDPFGNLLPSDKKDLPARSCRDLYPNIDFSPIEVNCASFVPYCSTKLFVPEWSPCSQRCTPQFKTATGALALGTVGTRFREAPTCIGPDGETSVSLTDCNYDLVADGYELVHHTTYRKYQPCNVDPCQNTFTWKVNRDANGQCLDPTCFDQFDRQVDYKFCLERVSTIGAVPNCVSEPLPYSFLYGVQEYGACSKSCGGGTRTRGFVCTRKDGVISQDPSNDCSPLPATVQTSQACNTAPCNVKLTYKPLPNAVCSRVCGGGEIDTTPSCVNVVTGTAEPMSACINAGFSPDCYNYAPNTPFDAKTCLVSQSCNNQACKGNVDNTNGKYYNWDISGSNWDSCHCPPSSFEIVSRVVECKEYDLEGLLAPVLAIPAKCDAATKPATTRTCAATSENCFGPLTVKWFVPFTDCLKELKGCEGIIVPPIQCVGYQMGQSNFIEPKFCEGVAGVKPTVFPVSCGATPSCSSGGGGGAGPGGAGGA